LSSRWFLACLVLAAACGPKDAPSPPTEVGVGPAGSRLTRAARRHALPRSLPAPVVTSDAERAACEAEWARVGALPALPGTPKLDPERAEAIARAKGEPVIFVVAPEYQKAKSPVVRAFRRALGHSRFPWDTLADIEDRFRFAPRVSRQILLRDGYLYADSANLAWSLWDRIELAQLFDEPELSIDRGTARLRVRKDRERGYLYADGPDAGKPARLLLFDRVRVASEPEKPPLHRDLRELQHRLGFERVKLDRLTDSRILAELRYGQLWVKSVLASTGARVSLACEIVPAAESKKLGELRHRAEVKERIVTALRHAMLSAVGEELPFDEPKTEWGQQDGQLRNHWQKAYESGERTYDFQGDQYLVFTRDGRPKPPEVCIDFITETLERASGTWFRPRGEPPGRTLGGLDFDALLEASRRQVTTFINYTRTHPEEFDYELVPETRRVPYQFRHLFYRRLRLQADRYQTGDIVIIRGRAPWDHYNVPHYHSFFVYEADPVTGMPILLAGNAGKPRVQSWAPIMERAPGRAIAYRIRPRIEWLARVIPDSGEPNRAPPPLEAMF
jgi:hypothetical protein